MTSAYPEAIPEEYVFGIAAELIVGLVYLITSLVCLVPLLLILRLFLTEKDMRYNLSYTIMFHIGILDLIQLMGHIASAVFVFSQSTFHPLVNKVLCGLCYVWGAGFTVCCLTPFASVSFVPKLFVWGYKGPLGALLAQIDSLSCLPLAAITFLIYVCIVTKLTVLKKQAHADGQQQRQEVYMLVQAILIFLYCSFFMSAWHFYEFFLPNCRWTYFIINTLWILNSGVTTLIYLTMNRTIRTRFRLKYLNRLRSVRVVALRASSSFETRVA